VGLVNNRKLAEQKCFAFFMSVSNRSTYLAGQNKKDLVVNNIQRIFVYY